MQKEVARGGCGGLAGGGLPVLSVRARAGVNIAARAWLTYILARAARRGRGRS